MKIITRVVIALVVVGLIGWTAYLLCQKSEEKLITFKTEQPFVTNTLVRTTVAGMVLDVPVKEGAQIIESNTFNEGTTIATIADMSDLLFTGKIK